MRNGQWQNIAGDSNRSFCRKFFEGLLKMAQVRYKWKGRHCGSRGDWTNKQTENAQLSFQEVKESKRVLNSGFCTVDSVIQWLDFGFHRSAQIRIPKVLILVFIPPTLIADPAAIKVLLCIYTLQKNKMKLLFVCAFWTHRHTIKTNTHLSRSDSRFSLCFPITMDHNVGRQQLETMQRHKQPASSNFSIAENNGLGSNTDPGLLPAGSSWTKFSFNCKA